MHELTELAGTDVRVAGRYAATGPCDGAISHALTFAAEWRYLQMALANPAIAAILVTEALAERAEPLALEAGKGLALHPAPRELFFQVHNLLTRKWLDSLAEPRLAPDAQVPASAVVGRGTVIAEGVEIGEGAVIGPGVRLDRDVHVGPNALVGVPGHFQQFVGGRRLRVEHAGLLEVGANTQILAGAIVQRDVYARSTRIGCDVVVGPGAILGHGVAVGDRTTLTGGVMVAGFTRIGADVFAGPATTIGNNLVLGDGCRCEIGAVIVKDVAPGERVSGNFAGRHAETLRDWARRR